MIGHANTVLKCGIFGLSNFHEQEQFFFTPGQIFSCLAISLHNQGLTRDGRLQARTKSGSKLHQCSTLYGKKQFIDKLLHFKIFCFNLMEVRYDA